MLSDVIRTKDIPKPILYQNRLPKWQMSSFSKLKIAIKSDFYLLKSKYFTISAPCFYETQRHIAQSSLNHHLRNELIIKIGTAPYGRRLPVFDDGLW